MKHIKRNTMQICTPTLLALGLFITSARADFDGWFNMDGGFSYNGTALSPAQLGWGTAGVDAGFWRLSGTGTGSSAAQLQRSPSSPMFGPPTGFTLSASPGKTAWLDIPADPATAYDVSFTWMANLMNKAGARINIYLKSSVSGGLTLVAGVVAPGLWDGTVSNIVQAATSGYDPTDIGIRFEVIAGSSGPVSFLVLGWLATPPAVPAPQLSVSKTTNAVVVSWPSSAAGFDLQENDNLANTNGWSTTGFPITDNGTTKSITVAAPSGKLFLRLFKP